jgi:hypothetical protein
MAKTEKPKGIHYVNNAEFSRAVVEYCKTVQTAKAEDRRPPQVTRYIAVCFMKICEGLSHRDNFIRYPFREEMVSDAVENCLRAVENYNPDAATRSGRPNAFSYFTQIAWFAFIRRITKEKRQVDIKVKYIRQSGITEMLTESNDPAAAQAIQFFVDQLRDKMDKGRERDTIDTIHPKQKPGRRRKNAIDLDLQDFSE